MSKQIKRLRQTSIAESFSLSNKKFVTLTMDKKQNADPNIRAALATAAEKRIAANFQCNESERSSKAGLVQFMKKREQPSSVCLVDTNDADDFNSQEGLNSHHSSEELFSNVLSQSEDELSKEATAFYLNSGTSKLENSNNIVNMPSCSKNKKESLHSGHEIELPGLGNSEDQFAHSSSADLFPELFPDQDNKGSMVTDSQNIRRTIKIPSLSLKRSPDCCLPLENLIPTRNHSIMFSPHIRSGLAPRPYPSEFRDKWEPDYVRMPCSLQNRFPIEDEMGVKKICSRWELICKSLRSDIKSSFELECAILRYNTQNCGKWNFQGLHFFINKLMSKDQQARFFNKILPSMIEMALQLPHICTQPIPLLKKNKDHSVTMSQKQISCLLLNAFFCTFPRRNLPSRRNPSKWDSEYFSYPAINFNRLFEGTRNGMQQKNAEKLKCLLNYFVRVDKQEPSGTVTFHRQFLQTLPRWRSSENKLRPAKFCSDGMIETEGHGMLQVDFANKFIGGGVLGSGCVQEEIRFVICPELIVTRLFTECLESTEVLIITGVEQYNSYNGYGEDFLWNGDFVDKTPRDAWGRRYTQLVAMDAVFFSNSRDQYKFPAILRELNKAYCGFYEPSVPENLPTIATGNWGCGAFNGTPTLKFLIQLMAASQAGRSMLYFTFGNKKLKTELEDMHTFLTEREVTVGYLYKLLENYTIKLMQFKGTLYPELYAYIYSAGSYDDPHKKCAIRIKDTVINSEPTNSTELPDSEELFKSGGHTINSEEFVAKSEEQVMNAEEEEQVTDTEEQVMNTEEQVMNTEEQVMNTEEEEQVMNYEEEQVMDSEEEQLVVNSEDYIGKETNDSEELAIRKLIEDVSGKKENF